MAQPHEALPRLRDGGEKHRGGARRASGVEPEWLQPVAYPTAGGRRGVLPRTGVSVGLRLEKVENVYIIL